MTLLLSLQTVDAARIALRAPRSPSKRRGIGVESRKDGLSKLLHLIEFLCKNTEPNAVYGLDAQIEAGIDVRTKPGL